MKIQKLFIILTILKEIFFRGQNLNGLAANQVQNLSTSRGRHLSVSDWSLWCALNQNCIGVKSKLGETLLGEDPLYVLCIYLLYEINITTLISIPYCSVAEGSYPFHPQKFHPRAFILSFSPLHFILTKSSLLFHLVNIIFTNSSPPFYPTHLHPFHIILYISYPLNSYSSK